MTESSLIHMLLSAQTMEPARIIFALVLIINVELILGEFVATKVGDSANFTATCTDKALYLTTQDNSRVVATLSGGVWTPGPGYRDRIQHHSTSCVSLTRVNYNDDGFYEFICDSSNPTLIQLEVVTPVEVPVTEGDPVRLQCHSFTAGSSAKSAKWEKDGALLFELDPSSKETRVETGYRGRLNVSEPDWHLKGDVSVTLDRVKPEDRGDYLCYGHDKEGRRKLVACRVIVKERNPDETTCAPPPACVSGPLFSVLGLQACNICHHVTFQRLFVLSPL